MIAKANLDLVTQLATTFVGPILFFINVINDTLSYGAARSLSYGIVDDFTSLVYKLINSSTSILLVCYILFGLATPDSAWLQYLWILHHAAAIAIFQNGFTLCSLFPSKTGLLINVASGFVALNTMIPQVWLLLIKR